MPGETISREDHIDGQQVLPLIRPLVDLPAMPGEIEKDGRVGCATNLQSFDFRADLVSRGILLEEDRDVFRVIPAERRIDERRREILSVVDLGQLCGYSYNQRCQ